MKRIAILYLAWVVAMVMLILAVTKPLEVRAPFLKSPFSYSGGSFGGRHFGSRPFGSRPFGSRSFGYNRPEHNDFYSLLRWICCAAFVYSAVVAYQIRRKPWVWIFGILAVLFNPIAPVYLQRNVWQIIDWAALGITAVAAGMFWRGKPGRTATIENSDSG